jgi:seryl-tRNA synthetase
MTDTANILELPGVLTHSNGQTALTGDGLEMFRRLDELFVSWAKQVNATEYMFPPFIRASELAKIGYFQSFPHLITMPVTLEQSPENLNCFCEGEPITDSGIVQPTKLAPIHDVLTPAACYHFYVAHQNSDLSEPLFLTTRAVCYRQEKQYEPLRRQWNFNMREIVCIGTAGEVKSFLELMQQRVTAYLTTIKLPIELKPATDPFFNPSKNPQYIMQKLDPVKTEFVFGGTLAIGSINLHHNHFGTAFGITRNGEDAYSGCVAFGIERWIYVMAHTFGPNPEDWPVVNQ